MTTPALGALVLASVLWGTAGTATKYALGGFSPISLLAVELTCAALALWLVMLIRGYRPPASWRRVIALGLCEPALAYLGETLGLNHTAASNAAVISGMESVFVVVLALAFLREHVTPVIGAAVAVATVGLLALESSDGLAGPGVGDLLVLLGALSAAGYTIVARSGGDDCDSLTLTAHQFAVGAVFLAPLALSTWSTGAEPLPTHVAARFWIAAAAVGIVGFAGSFLLYNTAIQRTPAVQSAIVVNLIPAFGLISAVLWLGEAMTAGRLVGATLIGLSVAVFVVTELRQDQRRHPDLGVGTSTAADEATGLVA